MRMPIDNEWAVDCDDTSCNLVRIRVITGENTRGRAANPENIGKTREEVYGYYGKLEQALERYVRVRLDSEPGTLTAQQVMAHIDESVKRVQALVACLQYEPEKG